MIFARGLTLRVEYGTYYFGYPKRDHNFDNHPHDLAQLLESQIVLNGELGILAGEVVDDEAVGKEPLD